MLSEFANNIKTQFDALRNKNSSGDKDMNKNAAGVKRKKSYSKFKTSAG